MKPQMVEIIKSVAALSFFFLTLVLTGLLIWKKKISEKLFGVLLMGMLVVMGILLGVLIDWGKLTASKINHYTNGGETVHAYGLMIKSIDSQQQYLADGDFRVVYTYEVKNTSPVNIHNLVPDEGGWFGQDIKYTIEGQIPEASSDAFHTLDMSKLSVDELFVEYVKGSPTYLTYLQWYPAVKPALSPGENLKYSVIISTRGTETEAFTKSGSYAGIGTNFVTDRLTCTIKAPHGKLEFGVKSLILTIEGSVKQMIFSSDLICQ